MLKFYIVKSDIGLVAFEMKLHLFEVKKANMLRVTCCNNKIFI